MRKLFEVADRYCKESSWRTLALLKICLFAMGIVLGTQIPKERKRTAATLGAAAFLATYIPLMAKFFHTWKTAGREERE